MTETKKSMSFEKTKKFVDIDWCYFIRSIERFFSANCWGRYMSQIAGEFADAIENLRGEASGAVILATELFDEHDLQVVRKELARIMEIVELKILPVYRRNCS